MERFCLKLLLEKHDNGQNRFEWSVRTQTMVRGIVGQTLMDNLGLPFDF